MMGNDAREVGLSHPIGLKQMHRRSSGGLISVLRRGMRSFKRSNSTRSKPNVDGLEESPTSNSEAVFLPQDSSLVSQLETDRLVRSLANRFDEKKQKKKKRRQKRSWRVPLELQFENDSKSVASTITSIPSIESSSVDSSTINFQYVAGVVGAAVEDIVTGVSSAVDERMPQCSTQGTKGSSSTLPYSCHPDISSSLSTNENENENEIGGISEILGLGRPENLDFQLKEKREKRAPRHRNYRPLDDMEMEQLVEMKHMFDSAIAMHKQKMNAGRQKNGIVENDIVEDDAMTIQDNSLLASSASLVDEPPCLSDIPTAEQTAVIDRKKEHPMTTPLIVEREHQDDVEVTKERHFAVRRQQYTDDASTLTTVESSVSSYAVDAGAEKSRKTQIQVERRSDKLKRILGKRLRKAAGQITTKKVFPKRPFAGTTDTSSDATDDSQGLKRKSTLVMTLAEGGGKPAVRNNVDVSSKNMSEEQRVSSARKIIKAHEEYSPTMESYTAIHADDSNSILSHCTGPPEEEDSKMDTNHYDYEDSEPKFKITVVNMMEKNVRPNEMMYTEDTDSFFHDDKSRETTRSNSSIPFQVPQQWRVEGNKFLDYIQCGLAYPVSATSLLRASIFV